MSQAVLIGSLWGFIEATLGGGLHAFSSPLSGIFLGPIGFGFLYFGLRNGQGLQQLILTALIAASFKFLDPIIFSMPFYHIRIINPAQAIVSQGLAFTLTATFSSKLRASIKIPVIAFISTLFSLIIFSLFSYLAFGYENTGSLHSLNTTIFFKLPTTALLTALIFYGIKHFKSPRITLPLRWHYAGSAVLGVATFLMRVFVV